jgi:hypothetical protein
MQTTTITTRSFSSFDGPRVVERTRGSAHPKVPTTRPVGESRRAQRMGQGRRP